MKSRWRTSGGIGWVTSLAAGPGVPGEAGEPGEATDHPDGGQPCEPPLLPALL